MRSLGYYEQSPRVAERFVAELDAAIDAGPTRVESSWSRCGTSIEARMPTSTE